MAKTYDLGGRTILELGCGKGEFLRLLCTAAGARGLGYDLAYDGPEEVDGVRFVRDYVTTADSPPPFDFLVSRHVLEHLVDPYAFLVGVRRHASDRAIRGYVEVPDARYDLGAAGWGCIYPHAGYFTGTSLSALLQRAGFEVQSIGTAFGGVFRYAEFATGPATKPTAATCPVRARISPPSRP